MRTRGAEKGSAGPRLGPKDREAVSKFDLQDVFFRRALTPPAKPKSQNCEPPRQELGRPYRLVRRGKRGLLIFLHESRTFRPSTM